MGSARAGQMATEIPAAITIPDSVETRLGTLRFTDGFPDEATVERVFDNLDFQRGVQAFLTAMPAASQHAQRTAILNFGPANQTILVTKTLMDSRTLLLTANTETVYGSAVGLDFRNSPVVVELPPAMLGLVDDFWFHYVTDLGLAGPDHGKGGGFVFLPPDFEGDPPGADFVVRSATFGNVLGLRGFLVDGDPGPAGESIEQHFRVYRLADADDPPENTFVDVSGVSFNDIHSMDFSFFEEVNEVVQEEPNEAIDPETLGLLASVAGSRRASCSHRMIGCGGS